MVDAFRLDLLDRHFVDCCRRGIIDLLDLIATGYCRLWEHLARADVMNVSAVASACWYSINDDGFSGDGARHPASLSEYHSAVSNISNSHYAKPFTLNLFSLD